VRLLGPGVVTASLSLCVSLAVGSHAACVSAGLLVDPLCAPATPHHRTPDLIGVRCAFPHAFRRTSLAVLPLTARVNVNTPLPHSLVHTLNLRSDC